jgi:hypothetical protein
MKSLLFTLATISLLFAAEECICQWTLVNNGMVPGNRALVSDGSSVFAAGGNVYNSTNFGAFWTQCGTISWIYSLAVSGNNVYSGTWENSQPRFYMSTNYGTSWTLTLGYLVYSLATNGNNIYAGTATDGVFLSTNSGTSWSQAELNNRTILSLAVSGNYVFAGTDNDGVYITTNSGINWTHSTLVNRDVNALAIIGNIVYAGTGQMYGVYKSTNMGASWSLSALNNRTVYSLAAYGNNVFAGTSQSGVYVSSNSGTSWTQRNDGLSALTIRALCISGNYIFAGEDVYGVYRRPLGELVGIHQVSGEVPDKFSLGQNYPNPFNPATKIRFSIPSVGQRHAFDLRLTVYDILGREIAVLVNEQLSPGTYEVDWDASDFPSGVYYYRLAAGDYTETKKMILIK